MPRDFNTCSTALRVIRREIDRVDGLRTARRVEVRATGARGARRALDRAAGADYRGPIIT